MDSNFWNDRYGTDEYAYGTAPNDFLVDSLGHFPKNSRVLCLADGEGRNGVYLATNGFSVTSVDMSAEGKRKAELLAQKLHAKINYVVADLSQYDIGENKWDAIVSIFCHLPKSLRQKVHAACVLGLKNDGIMLLEAYSPDQLKFNTGGPKDPDMLMTVADVKRELQGLEYVLAESKERSVIEGAFHHGDAAVIQIVARKV